MSINNLTNQNKIISQSLGESIKEEQETQNSQNSNVEVIDSKFISPFELFNQVAKRNPTYSLVTKVQYLQRLGSTQTKIYFQLDDHSQWQMNGQHSYIYLQGIKGRTTTTIAPMDKSEIFIDKDKTYDHWLMAKDFQGIEHKNAVRKVSQEDLKEDHEKLYM